MSPAVVFVVLALMLLCGIAAALGVACGMVVGRLRQARADLAARDSELRTARQERDSAMRKLYEDRWDPLTGVLRRTSWWTVAATWLRAGVCVVVVDLDGFKQINDQFGHMIGDEYLERIAKRMRASVGERGLIGRTGGDEFAAVLEDIECVPLLLEAFGCALEVAGRWFVPHASIGAVQVGSLAAADADVLTQYVAGADDAMYEAKHTWRVTDPSSGQPTTRAKVVAGVTELLLWLERGEVIRQRLPSHAPRHQVTGERES
jgi:diguanylate cyclase (GGDEF)-like protein